MACSGCGSEKIFARGLCSACYWRLRRNGSVTRKNVVNSGKCAVAECGRAAFSKNLCSLHYQRAEHPLKTIWKLLRSRAQKKYPPAWDNFEAFLSDVGSRPSPHHQLRRPDPARPWSLENMVWREPLHQGKQTRTREEGIAYRRRWEMRKKYNLTPEEYKTMWAAQNGVCAICGHAETRRHRSTGRPLDLVIDHCHRSTNVRGLLCSNCNAGLGSFDDHIDRLRAAIAYLERHAAGAAPTVPVQCPAPPEVVAGATAAL